MRVKPKDIDSWLAWGKLVNTWIEDPTKVPRTVGALRALLGQLGIDAEVKGTDDRPIKVNQYLDEDDPLYINLPTAKMRDDRFNEEVRPGVYPLPEFYDLLFPGAKKPALSLDQARQTAFKRIGEYVVNECC